MNDKNLINNYLAGDLDAFQIFYERYRKKFYTYLRNRFRDKAEDIYQNAFVIFLQEIRRRDIKHPLPYLYKIAMSLGIKAQKRRIEIVSAENMEIAEISEDSSFWQFRWA